jgi:hypothetical protein
VQHPDFYPTRANIFRACQWLTTDMQFGDSLFFHYSGHGGQLRDPTGKPAALARGALAFGVAAHGRLEQHLPLLGTQPKELQAAHAKGLLPHTE